MQSVDDRHAEYKKDLDLPHDVKMANNTALINLTGDIQKEYDYEQVDYSRE